MIAARLEARICAAVDAALASHAPGMARTPVVRGRWHEAGRAEKGPELKPVGVAIDVSVAPPAFGKFQVNKATLDCTVTARFRNASTLAAEMSVIPTCETVSLLLFAWLMDRDQLAADLASDGFSPYAIVLSGGAPPELDETADEWIAIYRFSVSGIVVAG